MAMPDGLSRSAWGDEDGPTLCEQQRGVVDWQVYHISFPVLRDVHTVELVGELPDQANLHHPPRSNVPIGLNGPLNGLDGSDKGQCT